MNKLFPFGFVLAIVSLLLGCAGSLHPKPLAPAQVSSAPAPRFLDVYREIKVSHLYFPTGLYRLHSSDKIGYYYRTPRGVTQHTSSGPMLRDGGIFVSKRDPKKIRGYVVLANGTTHVGNLSRMKMRFHN